MVQNRFDTALHPSLSPEHPEMCDPRDVTNPC